MWHIITLWGNRSALARLLALWSLLLVCRSSANHVADPVSLGDGGRTLEVPVRTGQEFLDAVRSLQEGVDTVISVPSGAVIDLTASLVLRPLTVPEIQTGSITIRGNVNGTAPSVLHLGWRNAVSVALGASVPLVIEDLILDGTCYEYLTTDSMRNTGWYIPDNIPFFPRRVKSALASVIVRLRGANVTWRGGEYDALFRSYPWYRLIDGFPIHAWWLTIVVGVVGSGKQQLETVLEDRVVQYTFSDPATEVSHFTRAVADTAADPVPRIAPWLKFQPHACGTADTLGELIPLARLALNDTLMVVRAASTNASFHHAMAMAEEVMAWRARDIFKRAFPAVTSIAADVTLLNATRQTPYQLLGTMAFLGPEILPAHAAKRVCIDFGDSTTPLLSLPVDLKLNVTSFLLVTQLTLTGLASAPLTPLMAPNTSARLLGPGALTESALPLWAIDAPMRVFASDPMFVNFTGQVQLKNVTLVLPQSDYAALVAALLRGPGSWKTGAVHTRGLMEGIQQLKMGMLTRNLLGPHPLLHLDLYQGWGVMGVSIFIQPEAPLPRCTALPQWDLPNTGCGGDDDWQGADKRDSNSNGLAVGLGVGLGVGVPLLLVLVGALVLVFMRSTRNGVLEKAYMVNNNDRPSTNGRFSPHQPPPSNLKISMLNKGRKMDSAEESDLATAPMLAAAAENLLADALNAMQGSLIHNVLSRAGSESSTLETALVAARVLPKEATSARQLGHGDEDALVLHEVLGTGSCGTVYRGEWRGLKVAVKTLVFSEGTAFVAGEPMPYERAVTEAAVAVSITHRNVVATYRFDIKEVTAKQEEGQLLQVVVDGDPNATHGHKLYKLFLVQEFCLLCLSRAMAAKALHRPDGSLCKNLVLVLMIDVGTGLVELHKRNIVHGDLKPANILLKIDESSPAKMVAKLTDFGLSVALDPSATHISNYKSGTPFYVAPEVLTSMRLSTASDIYAMGIVIWEAFTNRRPYIATKDKGYQANLNFFDAPSDPRDHSLYELVLRCARHDPTQRPSTAAVRETLISILAERGVCMPSAPVPIAEH